MQFKSLNENEEIVQIRESIGRLCQDFPPEYWRALDRESAYPSDFVKALSDA